MRFDANAKQPITKRLIITLILFCATLITINTIIQIKIPDNDYIVFHTMKDYITWQIYWGILQILIVSISILTTSHILMNKPLKKFINVMLTKLHNTEENLSSIQDRLKGIINAMPSVIIGIDSDGKITDWNTHAIEITKLSMQEVEGKTLSQAYPAYESYLLLAKQAMVKNSIQKHTKHPRIVDNENKYFDIIAYPVINNNSQGAVIRIDDVTSQVLLEDIMAQTEKMNSIGGLAAGIAHEINNPLGSIIQSGQNILRRLEPTTPKNIELAKQANIDINNVHKYMQISSILNFIQGIREAGKRAANIVNNLLQFTRTNNMQKGINNISKIIEKSIELASADYNLQKKMDFRRIKIVRDYTENLPDLYCCAIEIEQVILNILKNAAYALHMVNREPIINIKIWFEKNVLIIEIQDNGPGMNEQIKKKIFDPFFTTKPVGEGTGLGLSVSFNIIVDRHGGSFTVDSKEGLGSKFIIALPIAKIVTEELQEYESLVNEI